MANSTFRNLFANAIDGQYSVKNYITNAFAEENANGWSTYANTAANIPSTGTGGSATALTFSRSTSSPLRGDASFLLQQANSTSAQGQGVSFDFTIDSADQARTLSIFFNFNASSTFVASNGSTAPLNDGTTSTNAGNSDLEVFIYDKTNGNLIPVSPEVITAQGSNNFSFKGTFQTSSTSTSYRLILHVATTSANATGWSFKYDNVFVGPVPSITGAPITDWTSFSTVITGSSSNPTKGTITRDTAYWRRNGGNIQISWEYRQSSGGSAGSGSYFLSLPPGLSVDTTIALPSSTHPAGSNYGTMSITDESTTTQFGWATINPSDATKIGFEIFNETASTSPWSSTNIPLSDTVVNLSVQISVPILGWASNVQISNDADTRIVAAGYFCSTNQSTSSSTPINFDTKIYDTHSAVSTGTWKFTAPVSGYYAVKAVLNLTTNTNTAWQLYKNGSIVIGHIGDTEAADGRGGAFATVQLTAGDFIDIRASGSVTVVGGSYTSANVGAVYIERISGPTTIAVTDSVNMNAYSLSSSSITGGTAIVMTNEQFDTHGAYNTSTGTFTCPISGKYRVSLNTYLTTSATIQFILTKNGSGVNGGSINGSVGVATSGSVAGGSMTVQCNAGDLLTIVPNTSGTMGSAGANLSIERIGN